MKYKSLQMDNLEEKKPEKIKKPSNKEKIFIKEYLIHLNKSKAAEAMGCPKISARQQGYETYNRPHVQEYITNELKERMITVDETIKLIADTAQSNLSDYYEPVEVPFTPQVYTPLAKLIDQKREYILSETEFANRAAFTVAEKKSFLKSLKNIDREILRLQIELERNKDAFRILPGQTIMITEMRLNMTALVADKEKGKIKKIRQNVDGSVEVEMYSAQDAQEKLMKMFGKYTQKHELSGPNGTPLQITGMQIT